MPNQINPFNYDIDYFDSGFLGPLTDTQFLSYLHSYNLQAPNNIVNSYLGGNLGNSSNAYQSFGNEYDVSQSNPNIVDVPDLQDVAQTPSVYNNLTNPRNVNLSNNLPNLNPNVQNTLGQNTPIQAGLGQDATNLFNPNTSIIDLPSAEDVATIQSTYNNFTEPRQDNLNKNPTEAELLQWYPAYGSVYQQYFADYNTSYGVSQTLKLGYVGNVEEWVSGSGSIVKINNVLSNLFSPKNNKYGPKDMVTYGIDGGDEVIIDKTGLISYSTGVQGDFRDQLLTRTLGVGVIPFSTLGSGINFKPDGINNSQLDEIARSRRGQEVINRIKLNFVDKTVGALNVSPFNLLAGGSLIQQNYSITVPKTLIGKAAQFAADLTGFNLPTSIIPDGSFGGYGVDRNSIDVTDNILGYTGSGQKSLLYNALYINKYGPKLESSSNPPITSLGKILKEKLGAGQAPNTQNYLNYTSQDSTTGRKNSIIDNINQKVKNLVNKSSGNAESLKPNIDDTSDVVSNGTDKYGGFYGRFEQYESVGKDLSEDSGFNDGTPFYDDKDKNLTSYNGTPVEQDRDITIGVTDERFDWRRTDNNPFKKGLLKYTQKLVNESKLKSSAGYIGYFDSDGKDGALVDGTHQTGTGSPTSKPTRPSKGNVARNFDFTDNTGGDSYCRSWSSRRKYHTIPNLVRNDGNWWRNQINNPNLTLNYDGNNNGDFTGMPKIAWNSLDNLKGIISENNKLKGQMIPYMFSIENLAWKDAPQKFNLPKCEIGPNEGRIMWFPPYDINFNENTSVSWDTTNFIGRGEPIYTYNHTERSGTLDWKIIIDHSNVLNQLRKNFEGSVNGDEGYNSYFAGCDNDTLKELFANYLPENSGVISSGVDTSGSIETTVKPKDPSSPPYNNIRIYFENSRTSNDSTGRAVNLDNYEVTVPSLINVNDFEWQNNGTLYPCGPAGQNSYVYLNTGKKQQLEELAKFLTTTEDGKNYKIKVIGYTSSANPNKGYNTTLGLERATNLKKYLLDLMVSYESDGSDQKDVYLQGNPEYGTYSKEIGIQGQSFRWAEPESKGIENSTISKCTPPCNDGNPCDFLESGQANSKESKESRYAEIVLEKNLDLQNKLLLELQNKEKSSVKLQNLQLLKDRQKTAKEISNSFITECDYFYDMKRTQPFVYESIADKIKYFNPAFHSMTPEGFNSRLTFLQQCTRQGPQIIDPTAPQNMVFGRPPICVLRIGDFYHTKIVIDSLSIDYDPLQWDLNPEGIGVQPMIAKVSISFKFIGGSSLGGPITQLQNAVSYNFFANTSVYNPVVSGTTNDGNNMSYLYGSFSDPKQEKIFMNTVNDLNLKNAEEQIKNENKNTVNTTQTKDATTDQETNRKIEEGMPESNGNTTQQNKEGKIVFNLNGNVSKDSINTTIKKGGIFKVKILVLNLTEEPLIISKVECEDSSSIVFTTQPIFYNNNNPPTGMVTGGFISLDTTPINGFYKKNVTITTNKGVQTYSIIISL